MGTFLFCFEGGLCSEIFSCFLLFSDLGRGGFGGRGGGAVGQMFFKATSLNIFFSMVSTAVSATVLESETPSQSSKSWISKLCFDHHK